MTMPRMLQKRPYPNFENERLPESEREDAGSIRINIGDLHMRATAFWSATGLLDSLTERRVLDQRNGPFYAEWQLCAARDGVMSLYHFGRVLDGIDISLGNCPKLRGLIDTDAKRNARRKFERLFPAYLGLRHAIAHSAERSNTAQRTRKHGSQTGDLLSINPQFDIKGEEGAALLVCDNLWGKTFTSMWEGELLKCDISEQTALHLDKITDDYWTAFGGIIVNRPELPPTVTVSKRSQP